MPQHIPVLILIFNFAAEVHYYFFFLLSSWMWGKIIPLVAAFISLISETSSMGQTQPQFLQFSLMGLACSNVTFFLVVFLWAYLHLVYIFFIWKDSLNSILILENSHNPSHLAIDWEAYSFLSFRSVVKVLINTNAGSNHAELNLTIFQFSTATLVIALRMFFYPFLSSL